MICGTKADIEKFIPYVSEELATALQYIAETDFSNLADGEYPIDGDKVFARLSHYTTEPKEAKKPESHNQYIDVQYLAEGTEKIYYTAKDADKKVIEDYGAGKDLLFYGYGTRSDIVAVSSRILLMAKGAIVRENDVIAAYSKRNEVDYEKKQVNLFETIMPVNGNVNDLVIGKEDTGASE